MKIVLLIIGFLLFYAIFFIKANKIHINWRTFFRKGFKKLDNAFGLYCYVGKQRKR